MSDVVRISECRLCDSSDLELVVSFTPTPIGDKYLPAEKVGQLEPCYPLDVMACKGCGAVQLAHTVSPDMVYANYLYRSVHSVGLPEYFDLYAADVSQFYGAGFTVDIGSNDGTLLKAFHRRGCQVLGVDPAKDAAAESGVETLCGFFSESLAHQIVRQRGQAHIVTANQIMANVANMHDFTRGVKALLAPDGVFVFETGEWDAIVERALYDTIEHEHIHYFQEEPLRTFFARYGLRLGRCERTRLKGGSIRGYVRHIGANRASVADLDQIRADIAVRIAAKGDERWVGYGAAVGSTLLLHDFGLGAVLDELWDDNQKRIGLYSPTFHIPVVAPNQADRIVILAWRYADLIMARHPEYAGKWLIPLPTVRTA